MKTFTIGDQVSHRFLPAGMSGAGYFVKINEAGRAVVTNYDPRNGEYPRNREGSYQTTWALKNTRYTLGAEVVKVLHDADDLIDEIKERSA